MFDLIKGTYSQLIFVRKFRFCLSALVKQYPEPVLRYCLQVFVNFPEGNHIGADIDEMNVQPHMEPEIHLQNVWLCDMKGKTSFAHINYL